MAAVLSAGDASVSGGGTTEPGGSFFLHQSAIINGFMQRALEDPEGGADRGHALTVIQPALRLLQTLRRELRSLTLWGRDKEPGGSALTQGLYGALHGGQ